MESCKCREGWEEADGKSSRFAEMGLRTEKAGKTRKLRLEVGDKDIGGGDIGIFS